MVKRLLLAIAVGGICAASAVQAGPDPGPICYDAKYKGAGLKALGLMKAFGKNLKKPNDDRLAREISKAQSKFTKAFTKAEDKGGCLTSVGAGGVEKGVDECVGELIDLIGVKVIPYCGDKNVDADEQCDGSNLGGATCGTLGFNLDGTLGCTSACQYDLSDCRCCPCPKTVLLATGQTTAHQADKNDGNPDPVDVPDDGWLERGVPLAYVDNHDGTVTDLKTGLMWEKKSDDDTLHDKDKMYMWSGTAGPGLEETTIWDWLDLLNNTCAKDQSTNCTDGGDADCAEVDGACGFAGHRDWLIPNLRELHSIIDYNEQNPAVDAVFNTGCEATCTITECSCTFSGAYWSSTTRASDIGYAWFVGFGDGRVRSVGDVDPDLGKKQQAYHVRAVRDAL